MSDLPATPWCRRIPAEWPLAAQYALALAAVVLSLLARSLLTDILGAGVPFSLTLGVLLPLAFLVKPGPFGAAVVVGWLCAVYLFLPAALGPDITTPRAILTVAIYSCVLLLAMVAAKLAQRADDAQVQGTIARVRAEAQLRSNHQTFVELIENSPFGLFVVDTAFRMHLVGRGAHRILAHVRPLQGRDLSEVLRLMWSEPYASEAIAQFRHTLDTGEPFVSPEKTEPRDDTDQVESYDWRIERIALPDGQWGVLCHFHDISEQVRARRAIALSEQRYRTLFESIDEAFCVLEMVFDDEGRPVDFRYVEVNPAFEKQTGLNNALGRLASDVLPHEPRWFEVYGDVARTGQPMRFQDEARAIGRWFDLYAFRIGEPQEQKVAVLFRDITARREAEASIRFQARLLDEVGQAVIVTDPEGRIIYWNLAAEDLYGWPREDAIGRHVLETTVGTEFAARAEEILDRLRSGRSWSGEFEVVSRGVRKMALVTNTAITDDDGRLAAIVGVSMDISALKRAQQALEEADRRKDEFLATLSHELRNPLAAIRTALGVLARASDDPARVRGMRVIIDRQSAQLVRLIDDLLDVSRITRGKVELRRQPVDLVQVVAHAVDGVAESYASKGIRLRVEPPDRSMVIHADAFRLAQVVSNLLSNACKFTGAGGEVVVSGRREGAEVVVRVRDTGAGISADDLARVFDMFTQVGSASDHGHGLGIGLALASSIVTLHGGAIAAYSDGPGRGSEFVVRLPVLEGEAVAMPVTGATFAASGVPLAGRVLVVEDNEDVLEAVATHLRLAGHVVDTASTARDALAQARAHRPSVALLDIGLPDGDGYGVARELRQESWGLDVLLVAVTGWGQEKDKRRAFEAGFDVHLTKPVDIDALLRLLEERGTSTDDRAAPSTGAS